jgi:hypothetical protein
MEGYRNQLDTQAISNCFLWQSETWKQLLLSRKWDGALNLQLHRLSVDCFFSTSIFVEVSTPDETKEFRERSNGQRQTHRPRSGTQAYGA